MKIRENRSYVAVDKSKDRIRMHFWGGEDKQDES